MKTLGAVLFLFWEREVEKLIVDQSLYLQKHISAFQSLPIALFFSSFLKILINTNEMNLLCRHVFKEFSMLHESLLFL